jgi:transcriptional regulator with XRE-family HTH domain
VNTRSTITPEQIRARRTALGLSQEALGKQIGVTQGTISNWESGKVSPSSEQAGALAGVIGPASQERSERATDQETRYGDWLAQTRVEKGLSRAVLAAMSGISAQQISNIETEVTANPRASTRKKLENALNAHPPQELVEAVEEAAQIQDVGQFMDFDPHDENDFPSEPGVYVFYDISDRPIYVGESGDIRRRIRTDHFDKFWYRSPIVEKASFVRVEDQKLRRQLESTLIKFLKSNAVINKNLVER